MGPPLLKHWLIIAAFTLKYPPENPQGGRRAPAASLQYSDLSQRVNDKTNTNQDFSEGAGHKVNIQTAHRG